jgi:hypothetical protein
VSAGARCMLCMLRRITRARMCLCVCLHVCVKQRSSPGHAKHQRQFLYVCVGGANRHGSREKRSLFVIWFFFYGVEASRSCSQRMHGRHFTSSATRQLILASTSPSYDAAEGNICIYLLISLSFIICCIHRGRAREIERVQSGAAHAARAARCSTRATCSMRAPPYSLSLSLYIYTLSLSLSLSTCILSLTHSIYSRGASETSACCDKGRWCKLILISYISRFFVCAPFFLNKCFCHYFYHSRLIPRKKVTQYICSS